MARPRKEYRIWRHRRIDKKTGKAKESRMCHLVFRDHLHIERELKKVASDKSTAEYVAKNLLTIVNLKIERRPLTKELRDFIVNRPKEFRKKLLKWGILDAETNSGFEPLAEYAKSKGIGFGLWFEPERGRETSAWVTAHPEFYWAPENGANYHLNLTRRDVQDTVIEMLSAWIAKLDIRWLRWDYNHGSPNVYWDAVDPTGKRRVVAQRGRLTGHQGCLVGGDGQII